MSSDSTVDLYQVYYFTSQFSKVVRSSFLYLLTSSKHIFGQVSSSSQVKYAQSQQGENQGCCRSDIFKLFEVKVELCQNTEGIVGCCKHTGP